MYSHSGYLPALGKLFVSVSLLAALSSGSAQASLHRSGLTDLLPHATAARNERNGERPRISAAASALPENQARCLGPQKVLVLRVDFSDVPGEPVTIDNARRVLDGEVRPFLEQVSFGQTTIVTSVSEKVYRLPATASSYYLEPATDGFAHGRSLLLYEDAIARAEADYVADNYDRVIIALNPGMSAKFPDARWNTHALASQSGKEMWIHVFEFQTVAHELCHTYGASHSDLWRGSATDPIASHGSPLGYGDPTDLMGTGQTPEHSLAPFQRYLCGWLPETAVQGISTSGIYRVYRFDAPDTTTDRPIALRFSRDGMRHYWIGLRGGVEAGADGALARTGTGAYVGFAYQSNGSFYLLDLTPSYLDAHEIVLPPNALFSDTAAGISIEVVGSGGTGAESYLDVKVELTGVHSVPTLVGWGSTQSYESVAGANPPVPAISAAAGDFHTVVLNPDGTVSVKASRGMVLMGAEIVPAGLSSVVAVAAGRYTSGAVRQDGSVVVWGDNTFGLCTPPADLGNVRQLVLKETHALALRSDGSVVGWPATHRVANVPVEARDVVAIASTRSDGYALKRDGTLFVWGTNASSVQSRAAHTDYCGVAASSDAAMALRANGSIVLLFGHNAFSEIDQIPRETPVKAISLANLHGLALRADGSAVGWGGRTMGSLPFHDMKSLPPAGVRFKSLGGGGMFHSVGVTEGVGCPVLAQTAVRDGNDLILSWNAGEGAVRYQVEVSSHSTFADIDAGTGMTYDARAATAARIGSLDPAARYYYRVRSVSATGATSLSSIGIIEPAGALTVGAPSPQHVSLGGSAALSVTAPAGSDCRWERNGAALAHLSGTTVSLTSFTPENAGLYAALVTNGTSARLSVPAIVGLRTSEKVVGAGLELRADITHPSGRIFDQVLITGTAESITADRDQVTRTSFIDLDGDIVQVEFSGSGTLSLVLDGATGPGVPDKYNQPGTSYMTGHAGIVITGADASTHVSVFTVGRATSFDPTGTFNPTLPISASNDPKQNRNPLFSGHGATEYDGIADIAFIAIASSDGKFGGMRTANTHYFAQRGLTGVYAPGVAFEGPVYIGEVSAYGTAKPVLLMQSATDVRITGGGMLQANGQPVQIHGIARILFVDGSDSHGNLLRAQKNEARFEQDGMDVTSTIVINP